MPPTRVRGCRAPAPCPRARQGPTRRRFALRRRVFAPPPPAAPPPPTQPSPSHTGAARLSAACWLVPGLRAGTAVEIADAPTPESTGPWLLTRVVHTVGPGPAGLTTFEAVRMATAGGSGLLEPLA